MDQDQSSLCKTVYMILVSFLDLKSVKSLEDYWLSNVEAIDIIKNNDKALYEKLISKFKEKKDEINLIANGKTEGLDDKSVERLRDAQARLEKQRRQRRSSRYSEHHPNARFWKKP